MAFFTSKQIGLIAVSVGGLVLGAMALSSKARRDFYRDITDAMAAGDRIGAASALAEATIAAQKGNAQAARAVGLAFHDGDCVQQDLKEAERWFRRAAKLGDPEAQLHLEKMKVSLTEAQRVPQSTPDAFEEKRVVDLISWYDNWRFFR